MMYTVKIERVTREVAEVKTEAEGPVQAEDIACDMARRGDVRWKEDVMTIEPIVLEPK